MKARNNRMASIRIKEVFKSFYKTKIIHGISIDIQEGEFLVIVGPSGCGKSTLLRMVAGLETVSAGEIFINGRMVNEDEPMERNVAMVFQNYALYPHMNVFNNMAYGLKIAGTSKKEIKTRVDNAASILQLEDLLERKPRDLSGGQRQRVAMGRAIVRKPDVFLFDEPLSNLDAKLRVKMRLEIKALQRSLKTTSLYVTHDQVEAMTLADRMVVMNNGKAEQIGVPLEVYDYPATLFVAQFIGSPSMNIFKGNSNNNAVTFGDSIEISSKTRFDGEVFVGIRPEHLIVDPDGLLTVRLKITEPLGANTLVYGTVKGTNEEVVISLPGTVEIDSLKNEMRLSFQNKNIHIFDRKTNKRIG